MSELEQLVSEYNEVERAQAGRLAAIFDALAALPGGGHEIRFTNGAGAGACAVGQNQLRPELRDRVLAELSRYIVSAA